MKLVLSTILVAAIAHVEDMSFDEFVAQYGKSYSEDEYEIRKAIFKENVDIINKRNAEGHSYTLGINEFADISRHEFTANKFGISRPSIREFLGSEKKPSSYLGRHEYSGAPVPDSVDWTKLGAVTAVKDQQMCGSCYSFSATGAIEGRVEVATGKLVSLSEQQIVDCSDDNGNQGCNGGLMDFVFQYVADNGLCSETDYPYTAEQNETCLASQCKPAVPVHEIAGYIDVHPKDTLALMEALAEGPVSVAIEADEQIFQFYKTGVLSGECGDNLDHGVLAVGYGVHESGEAFWKVKNSWGEGWGDHGYIYLSRDIKGDGECGILLQASYPVIKVPKSVLDGEVEREEA
jgi:C1A family cysteine protease